VGWPPRQSRQKLIADQLSAGPTFVLRAKPKKDESYLGFLLRLAEINSYDTPHRILKLLGASPSTFHIYSTAASARLSLRLASLTKLDVKDLAPLFNDTVQGKYFLSFFDHPVPPYLLRPSRPRVCPECLSKSQYCRKQWDFSAVTSCPIHQIMLLEECPGCGNPITWFRKSVSHCPCGNDWRQTQTACLPEAEIVVSRLIYKGFRIPCPQINTPEGNNPLYNMDLPSLLSALFLITSQQEGRCADTTGKYIVPGRTSVEVHRRLLTAFSVFDNWPANFYRFLDHVSSIRTSAKSATGLARVFGSLHDRLYDPKYLPAACGDLLREQFENYVLEHWERGYVCSHQWFKLRGAKYISRSAAGAILKLDGPLLDGLISQGKIKGLIRSSGRRRLFIVEAASVMTFKAERERYLPLKKTAKLLGIKQMDALRLVDNSLLNAARGPSIDNHDTWQFEKATIDDFLSAVFTRIVKLKPRLRCDLCGLNDIPVSLTMALSSVGWSVPQLIEDILDGVITPRAEAPSTSGLARLLFSKQEINQYLDTKLSGNPDETFQLDTEGRALPFKARTLHFLARKKLIETKVKTHKGLLCRIITYDAVLAFTSKYVAAARVAREVGTRTEHLIQALKSHKICPISGPAIDGGPQYFLRRTDLATLNLKDLVLALSVLRVYKRKPSRTVDTQGAAKILLLTRAAIGQLVHNGTLKPYSESGKARDEYLFNGKDVERLRGQFIDPTNLLSTAIAAEILQLSRSRLYERWIRTGYLRYETSKDGHTRFLLKSSVDRIASFMSSIVTRAEAGVLLGVAWWRIEGFAQKGLLKPIHNPYPLAFWKIIYSRADVENLRGNNKRVVPAKTTVSKSPLSIRRRNLLR
jgi:hypothetical protein